VRIPDQIRTFGAFRYPGGKSVKTIQRMILERFPEEISEFREPFCGASSTSLTMRAVRPDVKVWINDLNKDIVHLLKTIRDDVESLTRSLEDLGTDSVRSLHHAYLELLYDDTANAAMRTYVLHSFSRNGKVHMDDLRAENFSRPRKWQGWHTDRLRHVSERLQGVKITNLDFNKVLLAKGRGVVCYIDPPYWSMVGYTNNEAWYPHNLTPSDHERLVEAIKKATRLGHRSILSYDDCYHIRHNLYGVRDGFYHHPVAWQYHSSSMISGLQKAMGKELLVTTFG